MKKILWVSFMFYVCFWSLRLFMEIDWHFVIDEMRRQDVEPKCGFVTMLVFKDLSHFRLYHKGRQHNTYGDGDTDQTPSPVVKRAASNTVPVISRKLSADVASTRAVVALAFEPDSTTQANLRANLRLYAYIVVPDHVPAGDFIRAVGERVLDHFQQRFSFEIKDGVVFVTFPTQEALIHTHEKFRSRPGQDDLELDFETLRFTILRASDPRRQRA